MPRKQKLSEGDKAIVAKAGVDNTSRRTWDKEEFAAKAAAQEKKVRIHGNPCRCGSARCVDIPSDLCHHGKLQDAEDEESPLDAKKRRRLGEGRAYSLLIGVRAACSGLEPCWTLPRNTIS
jgi:hypothetical protein